MGLSAKEQIQQILDELPDDSSYDEVMRELSFDRMIERGLADVDAGRTISSEEIQKQINAWAK